MIEIYLNPDPNAGLDSLDVATEPLNVPWLQSQFARVLSRRAQELADKLLSPPPPPNLCDPPTGSCETLLAFIVGAFGLTFWGRGQP